jgi:hypothetical protein
VKGRPATSGLQACQGGLPATGLYLHHMTLFEVYWVALGLPLSRVKGLMVDAIPFSVVESALYLGIGISLVAVTLWLPWKRGLPRWRKAALIGPLGLAVLGMGQGAFPLSLAPTAWRKPLAEAVPHDSLPASRQDALLEERFARLWREASHPGYHSLSETEVVITCDRLLDSVLARLGLPAGRKVKTIKPMGPLTTAIGLIYGGPAFHDPLFGELAMVRERDMPTSRFWRLHAACHETAHAKGFTREMDAEILTQAALSLSDDIRYQVLGDILFLNKSGKAWPFPGVIRDDMRAARQRRKEAEARQPVITTLRRWAETMNLRNSPAKYGDRKPGEAWNSRHPFYATLTGILTPDAKPIATYDAGK